MVVDFRADQTINGKFLFEDPDDMDKAVSFQAVSFGRNGCLRRHRKMREATQLRKLEMDEYVSKRFKLATRNHRLKVALDQGVHRHITLSAPGTSIYRFHLTTWPGHLAISGDLDDFVFSHLYDMFDFFRFAGPEYEKCDRPNYGYWAEKCQAESKHGGIMKFCEEKYQRAIQHALECHTEYMTEAERDECYEDARSWDLLEGSSDEREAVTRVMDWRCPVTDSYPFPEFYEYQLRDYTFGYKFACHAIQWGIKQYSLHHQGRDQASHDSLILAGKV